MNPSPTRWLGGAVVAAILAATALATLAAATHERDQARRDRREVAAPAVRRLGSEITAATAAVEDLRALFESSASVSEASFRRFTAAPLQRQAALAHLAWAPGGEVAMTAPPQEAGGARAALRTPAARQAVAAARDAAAPRMTPPIGSGDDGRTLVVAPVYSPGAALDTAGQRRAALRGVVSGAVELDALEREAEADLPSGASLVVRDGDRVVIGDPAGDAEPAGTIEVAGRRWDVSVAGVEGAGLAFPLAVGLGGLILAVAVAVLFAGSAGRERQALAVAARRAAEGERARDQLARLQVRHDLVLESAGEGIVAVDREGRATVVNPAAARMLGWSAGELTGTSVAGTVFPGLGEALAAGRSERGERELRRRDGSAFPVDQTVTPILERGRPIGAVVTFRDITARKRLEAQTLESLAEAEERAAIDPLTGLANHRTFHERLRAEVERARRRGRALSLVLMDLDHFKRVNDTHGHQAGDRVLQHAAAILASQTRMSETVARVGGEEFAMILPEAEEEEAVRAAERVRRAISAARFPTVGRMTISAGVCTLSSAAEAGADELYRLADVALYWAKHHGRDTVTAYSPEVERWRAERNGVEAD